MTFPSIFFKENFVTENTENYHNNETIEIILYWVEVLTSCFIHVLFNTKPLKQ